MLNEFITLHREDIITRCRAKVATRSNPPPSETEINHGVPLFLDQLVAMLRSGGTSSLEIDRSAGAVLDRSLTGLRDLIGRSFDAVRLTNALKKRKPILVAEFIEQIGAGGRLEADARGLTLVVSPAQEELAIDADRQVLTAVVGNLVQNAFKFTRPHSTVTLRVRATVDRVLIEVHDECGGLPGEGEAQELFASFEQQGADRTGLGIGLAFSRWGAEANGGRLYARNLPGTGCVFTVELPRSSALATASV